MRKLTTLVIGLAFVAMSLHSAQAAGRSHGSPASPTTNLKGTVKPKPGIIYIKGKRFTTCTDWGKDKGWCGKNM